MRKLWVNNSLEDRVAILQQSESAHKGVSQSAIEKDWWVTAALYALSKCTCAPYLSFKGGTSLSKGFRLIERFSEDIDLALHRSFFNIDPTSRSQLDKLRKASRAYIHTVLCQELDEGLKALGVEGYQIENITHCHDSRGVVRLIDSDKDPTCIHLLYESVVQDTIAYIPHRVKIEVSCLSMDEPTEVRDIHSLISEEFRDEDDLRAPIRTILPSRTFLEKIFLLSEEFQKVQPRYLRMSRHLYDIERLMDSTYGREALDDLRLYNAILEHRRAFYNLKYVDYNLLSPELVSIIPPSRVIDEWASDYESMREHFIYGRALPFDQLIDRIKALEIRLRRMRK